MALLFCDSFDHYETADLARKWTAEGFGTINAAAGRRSSAGFRAASTSAFVRKIVTSNATKIVGVAVLRSTNIVGANLITFMEGAITHVIIRAEVGGFIGAYLGSTSTLIAGGFSTKARIMQNQFVYLEAKVTIGNTGSVDVLINGEVILALPSVDTQNGGTATCDTIMLTGVGDFDDFYVCDTVGSNNTDFLGDVEIEVVMPTSDGNATEWTTTVPTSPTTHWDKVEEIPGIDDDTSYNETATNAHTDLFGYANLSSIAGGSTILAVQVNTMARVDSGSASIAAVTRPVAANTLGATIVLGTGWVDALEVFEQDPEAAADWTDSTFNAAEFGYEKIA